jgi:hypothetical protein
MGKESPSWLAIRAQWVKGTSFHSLSRIHGVRAATIFARCHREKWTRPNLLAPADPTVEAPTDPSPVPFTADLGYDARRVEDVLAKHPGRVLANGVVTDAVILRAVAMKATISLTDAESVQRLTDRQIRMERLVFGKRDGDPSVIDERANDNTLNINCNRLPTRAQHEADVAAGKPLSS